MRISKPGMRLQEVNAHEAHGSGWLEEVALVEPVLEDRQSTRETTRVLLAYHTATLYSTS